jgi:hypothetical protein
MNVLLFLLLLVVVDDGLVVLLGKLVASVRPSLPLVKQKRMSFDPLEVIRAYIILITFLYFHVLVIRFHQ